MNREELNNIIDKLEVENSREDAYLAIVTSEFYSAKANKEGLIFYALRFLKSARDLEDVIEDSNQEVIQLEEEEFMRDSEFQIEFIEPTLKKGELAKEELFKESMADKIGIVACLSIITLFVISTVIGFVTIIKWLF